MFSRRKKAREISPPQKSSSAYPIIQNTSYTSEPVAIPDSFLVPLDQGSSSPITATRVNFASTTLPEYAHCYALVLDNVLSPAECEELIHLAEQSTGKDVAGWRPAMVNAGPGREFIATDYRNSDRIIWDDTVIVERLLARCMSHPDVKAQMQSIEGNVDLLGSRACKNGDVYRLTRMNERMRFLRYGKGQFFRPHCDGAYATPGSLTRERSYYTFQLYLNDSAQALEQTPEALAQSLGHSIDTVPTSPEQTSLPSPPSSPKEPPALRGGATTFHSPDMTRRLDVDPKAGRVLIFQHADLLHSGDEVIEGVKFAMRTDFMYEMVFKEGERVGS